MTDEGKALQGALNQGAYGLNSLLGLQLCGMEDNAFVVAVDIDDRHRNDLGNVHGGVFLTLADAAMVRVAIHHNLGTPVQTAELKASFHRPFASGRIIARGKIVSAGRRLIFAEAQLEGGGRLLATATATLVKVDPMGERK